jgi:predicted phage baseplate assembly protein
MTPPAPTNHLGDCGCCEGLEAGTPLEVYNRPGLSAVAYRVGTHARFKRSMLARLSDSRLPALRDLNTREDDDFAVALLDAWATVADVLTFYSERIANESYLRTATERVSLLHLARLIGYELDPGFAAGAYLAFELEDTPEVPSVPRVVSIDKGIKVQSLPGQDELPQTFETVERIEARPEWNRLRPRQTEPRYPGYRDTFTYLKGVTTNLGPGDPILIVGKERREKTDSERWEIRRVAEVRPDTEADRTFVRWGEPLGHVSPRVYPPGNEPKVYALRTRAALFGHNAPEWRSLPVTLRVGEKNPRADESPQTTGGATTPPSFLDGIYANRQDDWVDAKLEEGTEHINLDAVYDAVVAGSWVVLTRPDRTGKEKDPGPAYAELYRVGVVGEETRADYTIAAKTTRLEISGEQIELFSPRSTTVYAQSEELPLAGYPITTPLGPTAGDAEVTLDGEVHGLAEGRVLVVSGTTEGGTAAETVTLAGPPVTANGLSTLRLSKGLENSYRRDTVTIYANVARATHGETRREVLGSGDASAVFQRFALREPPLTHTSAPTPGGTESSLEVRVGDIEWHEVPDLYGRGPDDRVFITRMDEASRTTVHFGDGRTGARLPSGTENVRATYRKGIGTSGLVRAEQLSLLMTPVLGVRRVKNPLAAEGGNDPEPRDEARRNAPLTVLTLDRVVSLRDYEDFARAYAGIAKALAAWVWTGETREVFVTVAGPEGRPVGEGPLENLVAAMRAAGDRHLPLRVKEYGRVSFGITAKVKVDPDHVPERVKAALEATLRERFGFEARSFGQGVALSEVVAAMQAVPGVVMVDVDELYRIAQGGSKEPPEAFLGARAPRPGEENGDVLPAELLTLAPDRLSLEVGG